MPGFFFSRVWIFSKKSTKRGGIVAGLVEILQAQVVGFPFERLGKLQEAHGDGQAGALPDDITRPSAHEDQRNGADVDELPAGGLPCAVARGYVRDFVRHHAGQLGFGIGFQDQAGVHKEKPAGQGKGIHLFGIQHLDGERHFGVRVPDQVLTHAVYVLRDDRVVDDLRLALHLLRQLFAESDLLLEGVEVYALANVAVANRLGIFLLIFGEGARRQQAECGQNCHGHCGKTSHFPATPV